MIKAALLLTISAACALGQTHSMQLCDQQSSPNCVTLTVPSSLGGNTTIVLPAGLTGLWSSGPSSTIYYSSGAVGIGTASPAWSPSVGPSYLLDVRNTGNFSQIHASGDGSGAGAVLSSLGGANANTSGGSWFNGANWIALANTAAMVSETSTGIFMYLNSGLTPGSSFTPTQIASETATGLNQISGGIQINGGSVIDSSRNGSFVALTATGTLATNITGSTQCVNANTSGQLSGSGGQCGDMTLGTNQTVTGLKTFSNHIETSGVGAFDIGTPTHPFRFNYSLSAVDSAQFNLFDTLAGDLTGSAFYSFLANVSGVASDMSLKDNAGNIVYTIQQTLLSAPFNQFELNDSLVPYGGGAWTVGTSGTPWNKGYFNNLNVGTLTPSTCVATDGTDNLISTSCSSTNFWTLSGSNLSNISGSVVTEATGSMASQVNVSSGTSTSNSGLFLTSVSAGYASIDAGMRYSGTQWIATDPNTASVALVGSWTEFTSNPGQTAGVAFTPTVVGIINGAGIEATTGYVMSDVTGGSTAFQTSNGDFVVDGQGNVSLGGSGSTLAINGSTGGVNVTADTALNSIQSVGGIRSQATGGANCSILFHDTVSADQGCNASDILWALGQNGSGGLLRISNGSGSGGLDGAGAQVLLLASAGSVQTAGPGIFGGAYCKPLRRGLSLLALLASLASREVAALVRLQWANSNYQEALPSKSRRLTVRAVATCSTTQPTCALTFATTYTTTRLYCLVSRRNPGAIFCYSGIECHRD